MTSPTHTPIDLYFSFRSPYSYLAAQFTADIERDYDVSIHLRPVLPLALREPDFFRAANLDRVRYIVMDFGRRAEMLDLPAAWPNPDPIVQDRETFTIADEQPYIHRLSHLGVEAQRRGKGIAFAAAVSRLIFGGTGSWDEDGRLAAAVSEAGLDLDDMTEAVESANGSDADHAAEVEANQLSQKAAGHTGVPLFVYAGEPFFGQDRIDSLCWRLGRDGLRR